VLLPSLTFADGDAGDFGRYDAVGAHRAVYYCGVNWVLQTCPELVDTSTRTG
jgi:hypothetical protein